MQTNSIPLYSIGLFSIIDSCRYLGFRTEVEMSEKCLASTSGAIIPPFEKENGNMAGWIDYALAAGVRPVVILEHYDCGVLRHLAGTPLTELPDQARGWLKPQGGEVLFCTKAFEHVRLQVLQLLTYPAITRQISSGQLEVAGWVYEVSSGDLMTLDAASRYNKG